MSLRARRRHVAITLASAALFLLPGCGSGQSSPGASGAVNCSRFGDYGSGYGGAKVSIFSAIRGIEAQNFVDVLKPFERCTGIDISWEASEDFESQLQARVHAGQAPDLAAIAQPGLIRDLAHSGALKPAAQQLVAEATQNYPGSWLDYASVGGALYGTPLGANVKSLVWYSPVAFARHGWTVPRTWAELMTLSRRIASDGEHPWCAGIDSGHSTGWPVTDWIEDILLRTQPPGVYDAWVAHRLPFNDPRVVSAVHQVGEILRDPRYVNGGFGDVHSIAVTSWQDGGLPVVDSGDCSLYHLGSFYANDWPSGTLINPSQEVYAFVLPSMNGQTQPLVVAGEFMTAFNDDPATRAVQQYLASSDFAQTKARRGGWVSINNGVTEADLPDPLGRLVLTLLRDPHRLMRFDGSDQMPSAVGTGTFWSEATRWISTGESDQAFCTAVEQSWPRS